MAASIVQSAVGTRVSSVLNRDVKQFGKKFLFDNNEETCWNSDQGTLQWVSIELQEPHQCSELHLQFQGGFASKTCWVEGSLPGGTPQWASIELQEPHQCTELHLQFQGGFASKTCWVEGSLPGERPKKLMDFYPQDDNTLQIFQFPPGCSASSYLKIVFAESTDFFGRITLYKLDILGTPS
eukprot:XP_011671703.1 PREDICTED: nuclear receptor 2C2-associated protein [Strongylocentrotus purpuratus]